MKPVSYFIATRGNRCENCGRPFTYTNFATRHHCIEPKQKRYPCLDNEINIELAGQECCHLPGKLDTSEHALSFALKQIKRGFDVLGWYDSLPLKVKRFPNLRQEIGC